MNEEGLCLCTYCLSGDTLIHQEIFTCETCNTAGNRQGVQCFCAGCADICHADHDTRAIAFGQAFCDCGSSGCELMQRTQAHMIAPSLLDSTDEAAAVKALQYHGEERRNLSIADHRTPFSVHEVLPLAVSTTTSETGSGGAAVFQNLREECITVLKESKETFWAGSDWKFSFDNSKETEGSSSGVRMRSKCQLEDLALMIFKYHTQALEDQGCSIDPSTSGAEWWIQVKSSYDGEEGKAVSVEGESPQSDDQTICLHYDKDEDAAEQWAVGLFPPLSTVTYLSEGGGDEDRGVYPQPTLVLSATANDQVGSPIEHAYLSFPRIGKHVAFDGSLLHGAPASPSLCTWIKPQRQRQRKQNQKQSHLGEAKTAPAEPEEALRVTFLVNIWLNHHPMGVRALDERVACSLGLGKERGHIAGTTDPTDKVDSLGDSMEAMNVSAPPPLPPQSGAASSSALSCSSSDNIEGGDSLLHLPLTSLISLQAHGDQSSHAIPVRSDDVFCDERPEDRDEGVGEDDVLLQSGCEQLCLPFISSKSEGGAAEAGEGDEGGEEEAGLTVRMILPPCPSTLPDTSFSQVIPTDTFHFVYCDEMCAPVLEYEWEDDDDEDDDDDDEEEEVDA